MPHIHAWEPEGVVKTFWGVVTGDEFVASIERVATDPRFDSLRFIVNDMSAITAHALDVLALERIAVLRLGSMSTNPNIRVLMVASEPSLLALLASADAAVLRETYHPTVFGTLDEARSWLAAQPPLQLFNRRRR